MRNWIFWTLLASATTAIYLIGQYGKVPEIFPWISIHAKELIGHALLYFCLGMLLARYISGVFKLGSVLLVFVVMDICAGFGVYDEFHQGFVQGRSVEFADVFTDMAGGALGAVAVLLLESIKSGDKRSDQISADPKSAVLRQAVIALHLLLLIFIPAAVYSGNIATFVDGLVSGKSFKHERSVNMNQNVNTNATSIETPVHESSYPNANMSIPESEQASASDLKEKLIRFARMADILAKRRAQGNAPLFSNRPVTAYSEEHPHPSLYISDPQTH